jgi:hypothetical protein
MLVYVLNYLTILLYSKIIKNRELYFFVVSTQIFLILALRSQYLGVDLEGYSDGYDYISTLNVKGLLNSLHFVRVADLIWPFSYESGYVVVNWLCAKIGLSFHGFLVLYAFFCSYSFGVFIYKYSKNQCMSFILFVTLGCFINMFGLLRQTLAIAILLYSVKYIRRNCFFKFLLVLIVAFTFHRLSIIFLPIYFVTKIKYDDLAYKLALILFILIYIAVPYLYAIILKVFTLLGKVSYIADVDIKLNFLLLLMLFIFVLVGIFTDLNVFSKKKINNICLWAFTLAIVIETLGTANEIISRAVHVFFIYAIILIPNIMVAYKNKKVVVVGKSVAYVGLFGFMLYTLYGSVLVPYVAFWG